MCVNSVSEGTQFTATLHTLQFTAVSVATEKNHPAVVGVRERQWGGEVNLPILSQSKKCPATGVELIHRGIDGHILLFPANS